MKTLDAARGKWRGVLLQLGVERSFLSGRHGPCPLCGGEDRFRFDNKGGNGSYICNQCGAGTGMQLLQALNGWDFKTAANEVDKVLGNVQADAVRPELSDEKRRGILNDLWRSSVPIQGTLAAQYLSSRCEWRACDDLRFVERCRAPDGTFHPALIALVRGLDGHPVNIHRTFLGPNGKADIPEPRAMMPGPIPEGSAIRLFPAGERLGIAEGAETAYAAAERFGVPVWSAINKTILAKWWPPEGVKHVTVFADNDRKYGGQWKGYELAHKLAVKGIGVSVEIPPNAGTDWADEW